MKIEFMNITGKGLACDQKKYCVGIKDLYTLKSHRNSQNRYTVWYPFQNISVLIFSVSICIWVFSCSIIDTWKLSIVF